MADDGKIRPSDYLENDGTIEGIIRQLNDLIEVFNTFEAEIKKSNFADWLNKVKKGSDDEKTALSALTGVVERLISANENLIAVRSASYKELQKAEAVLKSEKRNIQQEIELQNKMAGSYANAKLQLSKLTEEWKNAANPADKAKIAGQMERYASSVMIANKELKLMLNNFSALSTEQKVTYTNLEKQAAANDAVTASIKRRAKAQAELNEIMTNQGEVSMAALEEQMKKAVEERIALEAKELVLSDKRYASELSSAELIKQRIAVKEHLAEVEAKIKALEMQENNDLAELKARLAAKQQMLNKQAEILTATSAEGQMLAANEERLKRINRETELNAKLAVAVKGSYEYNKLLLEQQKNQLNSINLEKKVNLGLALAEIQATQQLISEAEFWTKLVTQEATAQAKINILSDEAYAKESQRTKELELELKYLQGMVDSRAKLAAMQKASAKDPDTGKSQLEEIALNNELADSIKKTETARAQASDEAVKAHQRQVQAQQNVQKARLEAIAGMQVEKKEADELDKGTYAQLEARYKLLVMQVEQLDNSTDNYSDVLGRLTEKINAVGDALEKYEKAAGKSSNRMSSRQREWNGLTNSVYQISRELPNLAVRADTFFLAISNNIPIFIDEFKRARKELGSFRAAFGETVKAFAKSIPLAVILLALSKWSELVKIADKFFGTMEDGSYKMRVAYRKLSDTILKTNDDMGKHLALLNGLAGQWKRLGSDNEKLAFLQEYKDKIEETGFAVEDLTAAETLFTNLTGLVVESFMARAKAAAAMKLATEEYNEAIQHRIKFDKELANITGQDKTSRSQLSSTFFSYFGGAEAGLTMGLNGKVSVPKEVYQQLANEYFYALSGYKPGQGGMYDTPFNYLSGGDRGEAQKDLYFFMEEQLEKNLANYEVPEDLMYAYASELLRGKDGLGKGSITYNYADIIKEMDAERKANARGAQFAGMAFESVADEKDINKKLNLPTADAAKYAQKSIETLASSIKTLNSAMLDSISESFNKQREQARANWEDTDNEIAKEQEKIRKRLLMEGLSEEERANLEQAMANLQQALDANWKAFERHLSDISAEEAIAVANTAKTDIDLRLSALSEGSTQELELRKQSIQKALQIELLENARKEKQLQQSESDIRAKYQRETEQAERDWLIKRNNWRKQQLELENTNELELSLEGVHRRVELLKIEQENELLESNDLIKNGLISREAILKKYLDKEKQLWREHKAAVLASQKSVYDLVAELASPDSNAQLVAQSAAYDADLNQNLLAQNALLEDYAEQIKVLNSELTTNASLTEAERQQIAEEIEDYEDLTKQVERYIELLKQQNEAQKKKLAANIGLNNKRTLNEAASIRFYMDNPQAGERQSALFELQQEKDILEYRKKNYQALQLSEAELKLIKAQLEEIEAKEKSIGGFKGLMSSIANHGIIGAIDMSTERYDAVNTAINSVKDSLNELMEAYTAAAQAAYDAAQAQVEAAQTAYEAELQARANGYANDVEGAKKELELEKKKAKEKEALLKKSQKAQEAVNTAMQISNLITGTSQILAAFAEVPVVAGILIATMWGMFALAKIKASQLASESSTYGEGGYEEAVGGSHASGHDIKTGIKTKSGKRMVIEGGEGVGVFSRAAVAKYGDAIPALVDDINSGRLSAFDGNDFADNDALLRSAYAREVMASQPMTNNIDLTVIEGMLYAIVRGRNNGQPVVLQDGSIMERKGNRTIITRK